MIAPPIPPDVDLRDFPYMPVDIGRLFGSSFHARASDAAWRAGVTLWLKSFHQVPAASLPDDDVELARLAELGRDVKGWRKVRAQALHGWQASDDGRLYHLVVAEKALEAWIEKLGQRKSSGAANAKRWGGEFDAATLDAQLTDAVGMLTALNPHSRALRRRPPKTVSGTPTGSPDGTPAGIPSGSQERGIEKGKRREEENPHAANPTTSPEPGRGGGGVSLEFQLRQAAGLLDANASALRKTGPIDALIAEGFSLDLVILPCLRSLSVDGPPDARSWAYFVDPIRRWAGSVQPASAVSQVALATVWVPRESPSGEAWAAYDPSLVWHHQRQGHGRALPSAWPPGHPNATEAAA